MAERAGGNPLFIEQLAAQISNTGGLTDVPATVRGLVLARMARMDGALKEAMCVAAVAGPRVRAETLAAACAMRNAPSYRILGFPSVTVSRKFWRNRQHSKE